MYISINARSLISDGLDGRSLLQKSQSLTGNDWIGLFPKGKCVDVHNSQDKHKCAVHWMYVPTFHSSGQLTFEAEQYKVICFTMWTHAAKMHFFVECRRVRGTLLLRRRPYDSRCPGRMRIRLEEQTKCRILQHMCPCCNTNDMCARCCDTSYHNVAAAFIL